MDEDGRELIYIEGMIHGYAIARGLAKLESKKLQHKIITKIKKGFAKLEKRNPQHKAIGDEIVKNLTRLEKRKPDYKIKILQFLRKSPSATPKEVARALDNADTPLPRVQGLKNKQTLWTQIDKTRYFKVLYRRA